MKEILYTIIALCALVAPTSAMARGNRTKGDVSPYSYGEQVGEVNDQRLTEISGMVASQRYAHHFWVHNDSGDAGCIYLIDKEGVLKAKITLPVKNRDWEGIACGDGHIYIGEIGDNEGQYDQKIIYRLDEPALDVTKKSQNIRVQSIESMHIKLAEGPRDSETLLYDPATKEVAFVTKREEQNMLYSTPYIANSKANPATLTSQCALPITMATAGDIDPTGERIIIKNYFEIYLWQRSAGETLAEALMLKPTLLNYQPEPQGEAISWHADQNQFYTISEQFASEIPAILEYSALD